MNRIIIRCIAILLIAAATSFTPAPAYAAKKCPVPEGTEISEYGEHLDISNLAALIGSKSVKDQIRKIPLIGKQFIKSFFDGLAKLPYKDSKKFGKYLEFRENKHTMTVFNIGDYAGSRRLVGPH